MARQQGRKAVIVLTDGVDNGSKMSLEQAIESAQHHGPIPSTSRDMKQAFSVLPDRGVAADEVVAVGVGPEAAWRSGGFHLPSTWIAGRLPSIRICA